MRTAKKNNRRRNYRNVNAARRTIELVTFDELTPEQQEKIIEGNYPQWLWDWYSYECNFLFEDEQSCCIEMYEEETNSPIDTEHLDFESDSYDNVYPGRNWDISQIFGGIRLSDNGYVFDVIPGGTDYKITESDSVVELTTEYAEEVDEKYDRYDDFYVDELEDIGIPPEVISEIKGLLANAQEFLDNMQRTANWYSDMMQNTDTEMIEAMLEDNEVEFIVDADGEPEFYKK